MKIGSFGSSSNITITESEIKEQMINNRVWALLILKIKDNFVGDIYSLQLKIGEIGENNNSKDKMDLVQRWR